MQKSLLFIDPDCPAPYTYAHLHDKPLGGTEATLLRVTEGLARAGYRVLVAQGKRKNMEQSAAGVVYLPFCRRSLKVLPQQPASVIVLNTTRLLKWMRRLFPDAGLHVWMHCFPGKRRRKFLNQDAVQSGASFFAVSNTLAEELRSHLQRFPVRNKAKAMHQKKQAKVYTVYNPIEDRLQPDSRAFRKWKLVFFSSPHKGLWEVLEAFTALRKAEPRYQLYIANPGYVPLKKKFDDSHIHVLGTLRQQDVIRHVREAFCVFYPQKFFRETFGLVFAEANAVGTPVLTHPGGAAQEILENKEQLVDVTDRQAVTDRLAAWQNKGRPGVRLPQKFRLSNVLKRWQELVNLDRKLHQPEINVEKEITYAGDQA